MASLMLRMLNAGRLPLDDQVDLEVVAQRTDVTVLQKRGVPGKKAVRVTGLMPGQSYRIRVFPLRHRPVGQFASTPVDDAGETNV